MQLPKILQREEQKYLIIDWEEDDDDDNDDEEEEVEEEWSKKTEEKTGYPSEVSQAAEEWEQILARTCQYTVLISVGWRNRLIFS